MSRDSKVKGCARAESSVQSNESQEKTSSIDSIGITITGSSFIDNNLTLLSNF